MTAVDDLLFELEQKIANQSNKLQRYIKENQILQNEIQKLENDLETSIKEIKTLENKNKEIKVVSGLAGNAEHKRLMKHKLNGLVKEIDLCIAEVKRKSI